MTNIVMDTTFSPAAGGPSRAGAGKNMADITDGASLFAALQERLGLKLEQHKTPADFPIVDRAEKVPVEN